MTDKATTTFTKDRPILLLACLAGLLAACNVLLTIARLRSHDFKVPVQYIVHDGSVLQTASWYSLYSLGLFSAVGAGMIIFLAYRLHKGNRLFAGGLLLAYSVLGITTLLVSNALLSLVAGV